MSQEKFIPPLSCGAGDSRQPRNVVFLFDGTGDTDDNDVTNVIRFRDMLYNHPPLKRGGTTSQDQENPRQIVFYRPGIGTWDPSGHSRLYGFRLVSQAWDKAVAWNFESHVITAYKELTHAYKERDRICLFGFSRGAYTARAVAAMIGSFGILRPGKESRNEANFKKIQEIYFRPSKSSFNGASLKRFRNETKEFREKHRIFKVTIEIVGVWDTVNSVGLIMKTGSMYTSSNLHLKTLRHAIALDERRARFDRAMWRHKPGFKTDIEQVWFAGAHCDVGGGSVKNGTKHNLANIPLRWMIRECFKTQTGIVFDYNKLQSIGIDIASLHPIIQPRPEALCLRENSVIQTAGSSRDKYPFPINAKTEEEHDHNDALTPIHDRLSEAPLWGVLEVFKLSKYEPVSGKRVTERNLWKGRKIWIALPESGKEPEGGTLSEGRIKVHRSVRMRMMAKSMDRPYVPAAALHLTSEKKRFNTDSEHIEWVD
ncbi:hypothetical protein VKT23_016925 [Stygiomarasmius scandens]|uniref:T6SS Phospholipase effector Tle1-like catalytic domain-containing protein n=1 Tax=Marasmiellus scandens TaxID=2682957 RepID=A0ABR1ITJ1_9AGAR